MIRVAVLIVATIGMPVTAFAQLLNPPAAPVGGRVAPPIAPPSPVRATGNRKPIQDSYYSKRQETKAAAPQRTAVQPTGPLQTGVAETGSDGQVTFPAGGMFGAEQIDPVDGEGVDGENFEADGAEEDGETSGNAPTPFALPQLMGPGTSPTAVPAHYSAGNNQQETIVDEEVSSPQSSVSTYSTGEDCGDDGGEYCDEGDCHPLLGRMQAALACPPTCNVLWNEIQSTRSMWASFDYLGFWAKGFHVPPLVTTSPQGTSQATAGVLGAPGTSILFGDQRLTDSMRSGGRITIGGWIVGDVLGIEGNYYALQTGTTNYAAQSTFSNGPTTDPILARPFFDPTLNGGQGAQHQVLLAYPDFNGGLVNLDGTVNIRSASTIQSAGVLLRRLVAVDLIKDHRMFLVGGYRWFRVEEGLEIHDTITPVGTLFPIGSRLSHFDSFGTKNQFNGGDIGLMSDLRRGRWVLETTGKVALGNMHEVVNIDGQTKVINGASVVGYPGGILTQVSNMGVYRRDQFTLIPELNAKLGYQVTCNLRATVGYNFTYVTRVARPGNVIDFSVALPPAPGAAQPLPLPAYLNNPTNLWLQGFTAGIEYHW